MRVEDHLKLITALSGQTAEQQLAHQKTQAERWDDMQVWADRQHGRFTPGAFRAEADRHREFAGKIAAHLDASHDGGL